MGDVYRVVDERTGRQLALKRRMRSSSANDTALSSQFEREYHTLCELAHPRIIEVYDFGMSSGDAYYTMELLDGQDLHERGQLPWRSTSALLVDVASSLAIIHSRGFLHRDLSPRNVRCTADGRAKLIDFGALTPIGPIRQLIGTPPFIPPEALQLQSLDARADLYALGALAYWMLAGRNAYPARSVQELRDVWLRSPAAISKLQSDVPEALDRLVMGLLHLNRAARPATAAEVMERLAGIAGLTHRDRIEVTRAYLVTPPLIDRAALLDQVRTQLAAASGIRAACSVITGVAGTGRSRFLDACVLEAKLLGATVLRADASDAVAGEYGAVRALCQQLIEELPQLARSSASPRESILANVVKELAVDATTTPEPTVLHAALSDWFVAVARSQPLVIAVDDADAIDAESAAWLATLAMHSDRHGLSLLFVRNRAVEPTPAIAWLVEAASQISLEPFTAAQTEAFIRGVFGVDQVAAVAERIHELAEGNPRETMALVQWLVERGTVRHEAGSWTLPVELRADDLPVSLTAAWLARIETLSADARELGEALSITDVSQVNAVDYPKLTAHEQPGRTYRAVDALINAGVLVTAGEHHRFRQPEIPELLSRSLSDSQRHNLHGRIARMLEAYDKPMLLCHHLLCSGQELAAIERMLPLHIDPRVEISVWTLSVVQNAIDASERIQLSPRASLELRMWLMTYAALLGDYRLFVRYAIPLLRQFERDSGLADYNELDPTRPAQERLVESLTRVQQRFDLTPEAERRYSPIESIRSLARACSICVNMASIAQSLELVESLPSLEPFAALSPALVVSQLLIDGMRAFQSGRYDAARLTYLKVLERVQQPDDAGLEPVVKTQVRLGMLYFQAVISTIRGIPSAAEWLVELEQARGHRVNAWRVHMASHLMQVEYVEAAACQRSAELAQVQDVQHTRYRGTTVRLELLAYARANDLLGVKRTMERTELVAHEYPRWEVDLYLARYHYKRLSGDDHGALEALLPALQLVAPGRHINWALTVSSHVYALCAVGREAEAVRLGFEYLESHEREGLTGMICELTQSLAEALVKVGRLDEAAHYADRCVHEAEVLGSRGVFLGIRYEARARVALAMGDRETFSKMAASCAREYRPGQNSALTVQYERLMRDAAHQLPHFERSGARVTPTANDQASLIRSRLSACANASELASQALKLLSELAGASAGYLFGWQDGSLRLLASEASRGDPPALLCEALGSYWVQHLDVGLTPSAIATANNDRRAWADPEGRPMSPVLLVGTLGGRPATAAVATLYFAEVSRRAIDPELSDAIATTLLEWNALEASTEVIG
jgi:hypothetical protein